MDPYTERLVERTRQRREMLNAKLGKTPDPAPRKRVLEDTTNIQSNNTVVDDDSPKRQRVLDTDRKADTPAVPSVKSRLNALSGERMHWSDAKKTDEETMPQKTFDPVTSPQSSPVNRKGRFAQLAQHLDDFECDMSHPTIKKTEEKKPKWQPPKRDNDQPVNDARDRHVSNPQKEYELYQGPTRATGSGLAPSPKKTPAPAPPPPPPAPLCAPAKPPRCPSPARPSSLSPAHSAAVTSPKISKQTIELQRPQLFGSPKFAHQVKKVTNQVPVNARPDLIDDSMSDEPTAKPVMERMAGWKKTVDTPNKSKTVEDPTQLPLSERFAGWEQRVSQSQTPIAERPLSCLRGAPTPKQSSTTPASDRNNSESDDPAVKPVSDIRASWKEQDAKNNPKPNEEPTAYSVSSRMSAWEVMSSANQVSNIKKVNPASSPQHSPSRAPVNLKPGGTPTRVGAATWKTTGTPNKGLTPQKSFKECIEEKASQLGRKPSTTGGEGLPPKAPVVNTANRSPHKTVVSPARTVSSPVRPGGSPKSPSSSPTRLHSPTRVGSATKSLQQRLMEQVQNSKTDQLAEKLRQERMAEVNALHNRFEDGILKDNREQHQQMPPVVETTIEPPAPKIVQKSPGKKESIRAKAREDFNNKLQSLGFEISDEGATYEFKSGPSGAQCKTSSAGGKKGSSIYRLVSKRGPEEEKPVVRQTSSSSMKKVKFEDQHNISSESNQSSDQPADRYTSEQTETEEEVETQSETQESFDDSYGSSAESSIPESYKGSSQNASARPIHMMDDDDDDDVSLSAFVPASVRKESVMPQGPNKDDTASITSGDSMEYQTTHHVQVTSQTSSDFSESDVVFRKKQVMNDSTDESDDEGNAVGEIDDLLDEAMDDVDISQVEMRRKEPQAAPRKRRSYMCATTAGELHPSSSTSSSGSSSSQTRSCSSPGDGLAYSVSMYRNNRYTKIQTTVNIREISQEVPVTHRYSRHSHYVTEDVKEEDIEMPKQLPPDVQQRTIQDRIKELHELVSQEQSVIMQTSNALNKCCTGDSMFAGSAEQVECNRLLLVACQRRQAYLMEIQRLKETGQLEPAGQEGPKGSLTISDIRLPLKKNFVTKIGTTSDNTVHYFVILIRNGPQIILTQMLSTHDPMMRGSLDFPNLIKIHGISSNFYLNLEVYSMSVCRETIKDKKKKTPKKHRPISLTMESPGGPTAVRTTSFTQITSLPITMKCLDKNSFSLDRVPFLSPLHDTIYMRLKCMMEQNVEERGFLTMFEDVSGLGSWHRRWCVLTGNKLAFWKYPDDETRKDPMGFIDLKRCITEKVGLIPRDICARPHTFEMVVVRPPRRGEQDTLVTKTYNTMTTTRYMLSADTKEERIVWCNKVNRALANIRTWNADAMRPVRPPRQQHR